MHVTRFIYLTRKEAYESYYILVKYNLFLNGNKINFKYIERQLSIPLHYCWASVPYLKVIW